MEYEPQQFFTEKADSDVKGFAIIEVDSDEGYHIAEKWSRREEDGGDTWLTYWLPSESLEARVAADKCVASTTLTDTQFSGVLNLIPEQASPIEA